VPCLAHEVGRRRIGPLACSSRSLLRGRVRVDLFSVDADNRLISAVARSLDSLLTGDTDDADAHSYGVDQGLGVTERPVVVSCFGFEPTMSAQRLLKPSR
jgi:hypothetical protein